MSPVVKNRKILGGVLASVVLIGSSGVSAAQSEGGIPASETFENASGKQAFKTLESASREFEVSFVKVSQTCKIDHASFEAVEVPFERMPAAIQQIHLEV